MYECDCCGRKNVPEKLKGIGYVCDDCLESWTWTGYESGPEPVEHGAGRTCPFKQPRSHLAGETYQGDVYWYERNF